MIYLNNRLVPESRATISVFDHGFLYGDGIYETMRAYKGTVFMLDKHIERLFSSASRIELIIGMKRASIIKAVYDTTNSGLPHNSILSIAVDDSANKWIGTMFGLLRFFENDCSRQLDVLGFRFGGYICVLDILLIYYFRGYSVIEVI